MIAEFLSLQPDLKTSSLDELRKSWSDNPNGMVLYKVVCCRIESGKLLRETFRARNLQTFSLHLSSIEGKLDLAWTRV